MSRARSAIAARTTVETLKTAALKAFESTTEGLDSETHDDFFDAVQFCRPLTEDLGGPEGSKGWIFWQVGEWAVMTDLGTSLQREDDPLERLSEALGEVIVCAIDNNYEYAFFGSYDGGRMRRRLVLEDDEFLSEGLPVKAERGSKLLDFTSEDAERLWGSYKLPTFEFDPQEGPFSCFEVKLN